MCNIISLDATMVFNRGGGGLSPVLFALYMNDLEDYLFQKEIQ